MKIAITGGTGLLGRYFVRRLLEDGQHIPVILTRKDVGKARYGVEARRTDYSVASLVQVLRDVDAVIHLAAQRGNSPKIVDFAQNEYITQSLYDACIKSSILNIVYASTIAVYSKAIPLPFSEGHKPAPQTIYGISKLCCENIGELYAREHGLKVKNLRLPPIFGVVEDENNTKSRMINRFIVEAFSNEKLTLFSKSSAKREFLYAKDAAEALLCAVEAKSVGGTFNVGSGECLTNQEVAEMINEAFNNQGNLCVNDRQDELANSLYMNSNLAAHTIGYKARYSFYEAIRDIYKEMADVHKLY